MGIGLSLGGIIGIILGGISSYTVTSYLNNIKIDRELLTAFSAIKNELILNQINMEIILEELKENIYTSHKIDETLKFTAIKWDKYGDTLVIEYHCMYNQLTAIYAKLIYFNNASAGYNDLNYCNKQITKVIQKIEIEINKVKESLDSKLNIK